MIKKLLLFCVSLLLSILVIESFSRYYVSDNPSDPNYICKWSANLTDMELCRLRDSLNSKELTMSSKYESHDICDSIDPILGWKPRQSCTSTGIKLDYDSSKKISYNTNSLGARGTREVPYEKDKNKFRILFIGDSFTFGEDVSDKDTYPEILQNKLGDEYEVVNLGVHGYGLGQSYLRLKSEGIKYKPDMVILGLFMPDIIRDKQKVFGYFKPKFDVDDNNKLNIPDRYIPTLEEAKTLSSEYNNQFRFISLSKIHYELKRVYDRATSFNNDLKISYAILKEIQKLSDENKFTFSVLYIPTAYAIEERSRFEKLIGYDESFWNVIPKIKLLLSDIDIDFIDPVDKMREYQKNTTDALYKGHTTPLGNKVMADVVSQYLKNKKIVRH
jgi:lysophospholipase L1-like esterase